MLRLYNTMSRKVEPFKPIEDNQVGLYTCGPTVYTYAHIGNLRTYLFEDVLKRALLEEGYRVRHVMNITDVGHLTSDADSGEDKMEVGARREGRTVWQVAEFYTQEFRKDLARLNVIEPDVWCKVTDHIPEQIELIRVLEAKGFTYVIGDGVYFDTSKLSDYGKLSRLNVEGLQAGARVEMVQGKRNITDFALWKFSPSGQKRQMEWPSPWGVGFPGWHIECSALALKYLGERLDIHCGATDAIPIHHNNEIAQSEAALGHEWVNWWMHGEFLTLPKAGGEEGKMSKSSGGFLALGTLVERGYDPLAWRYVCLGAHYRQQLAFTWEALDAAANALDRLRARVLELKAAGADAASTTPADKHLEPFRQAVRDDLNMPRALAAMWGLLRDGDLPAAQVYATLVRMDRVLGLGIEAMAPAKQEIPPEIMDLVQQREQARKARDFAKADRLRGELAKRGATVKDGPAGPRITYKPR
jgi:cysteinyl-tRNA synthetase